MRITKLKKIIAISLVFVLLLSSMQFDMPKAYAESGDTGTSVATDSPASRNELVVNSEYDGKGLP